jgi:hypothetical protein
VPTTYLCPTQPRPPAAAQPLVDPMAALHLVSAVFREPAEEETVCILLASDRTGLGCVSVAGAASADSALRVARLAAAAAEHGGPLGAVVVATSRPGWSHLPDECDEVCFSLMREDLAAAGVVLVDWFLVDAGRAGSMAELGGHPSRWQP